MRVVIKYPHTQYTEKNGQTILNDILDSINFRITNNLPIEITIRRNGIGCNEIKLDNATYIFIVED